MSTVHRYYNDFYRELSRLDDEGSSFDKIADLFPPLPAGGKILDVGAGHGAVGAELVRRGYVVHGIEIAEEALASLRARGIEPIAADISQPLPVRERYDVVLLLDVLEHVFDPVGLLAEAARVLAPGGAVILTVPLYFDLVDRLRVLFTGSIVSYDNLVYGAARYRAFRSYTYDHVRFFRPADVPEMCGAAGLRVEARRFGPLVGVRHLPRPLRWLASHPRLVERRPSLFAHTMAVRARA
jgi:2-polyprenyl-3-methyl-5-hydroxy-6-metoxy-1,4-benzoquinol methylase